MPYQIPPMPRPGQAFIQAYLQGLQARRDREEAEGRKEDREEKKRQTTLNFLLGIAKMTGKPGQVNKYIKENMPELGEIEMPQVGGTKKEVLTGKPTDVAAGGDIATKEIVEGGTPVSPGVKAKWDLADLMGLSEEQKKQYLTGIKPTGQQAKVNALKEAGATSEQIIRAFGGYIKTKEPQVVEIGVKNKPNYKQRAVYDFVTNTITKRIGSPYKTRTDAQGVITPQQRTLNRLGDDYFQAIGRYGAAKRGVGQFLPDPNKELVADFHLKQATQLAEQYKNMGGNLADLGITQTEYTTPEEVKQAFKDGKLTKEEATKILTEQFGFEK